MERERNEARKGVAYTLAYSTLLQRNAQSATHVLRGAPQRWGGSNPARAAAVFSAPKARLEYLMREGRDAFAQPLPALSKRVGYNSAHEGERHLARVARMPRPMDLIGLSQGTLSLQNFLAKMYFSGHPCVLPPPFKVNRFIKTPPRLPRSLLGPRGPFGGHSPGAPRGNTALFPTGNPPDKKKN